MVKQLLVAVLVLTLGAPALAQSNQDFTPPPLVPASPPPMPASEPGSVVPGNPGTPPPPGAAQPPGSMLGAQPPYMPGPATGYQYSPYGSAPKEKPGPEVGMMLTEALFGILTAAGITVLPYVLFAATDLLQDSTLSAVILISLFAAAPLAVAQAQVGIANGSAYWRSETWVPLIAGLLGEGLVFLTYFYANGRSFSPQNLISPTPDPILGVPPSPAPTLYLFIASVVGVPLLQMAAINLFKQPKFKGFAFNYQAGEGFALGVPTPTPYLAQTTAGPSVGVNLSLLNMRF